VTECHEFQSPRQCQRIPIETQLTHSSRLVEFLIGRLKPFEADQRQAENVEGVRNGRTVSIKSGRSNRQASLERLHGRRDFTAMKIDDAKVVQRDCRIEMAVAKVPYLQSHRPLGPRWSM
jgi:hypothetical protein